MLKLNLRTLFVCTSVLFLLSGVVSCKKNSDSSKSKTELLTQAGWKLVKYETKSGSGAWTDFTASISACDKDDNYVFNANGTYEYNEGTTKCSPTDPQIIDNGTWAFLNNETQLKTTSTGGTDTVSIDQLDGSTLMATYTYTVGSSTYYERSTYGH